jgi:methionyl-tRNA formyltransferase
MVRMRIAFFGLPLAAWLLHRDGHEIVYAGISRPGPGLRRLKRVLAGPVEMKPDVTSPRTIELVRSLAPDLIMSWFWTTKLPLELVTMPPYGGIGVHPSLLPRHRGPDPYFWTIDCGDDGTGVTAHVLSGEYDTGGILGMDSVKIDPSWNAWQLARALDRPSLAILREMAQTPDLGAIPQSEERATLAPFPTDEQLEINWKWTSERIMRRIRAAAPSPGAWTFLGDEAVTITRAAPVASFPRALHPGEATVIPSPVGGTAIIRTADGALALLEGSMDAAEGAPPYELGVADLAALVAELAKRGESPSIEA